MKARLSRGLRERARQAPEAGSQHRWNTEPQDSINKSVEDSAVLGATHQAPAHR